MSIDHDDGLELPPITTESQSESHSQSQHLVQVPPGPAATDTKTQSDTQSDMIAISIIPGPGPAAAGPAAAADSKTEAHSQSQSQSQSTTLSTELLRELQSDDYTNDQVTTHLNVNTQFGLSRAEAASRLLSYGSNELDKEPPTPIWALFLIQFMDLIIVVLLIASGISIAVGEWIEGVAIIIIILLTAILATVTEYSSGNALEALAALTDPHAHVIRDGEPQTVSVQDLVPGDILIIRAGDLVPADARLIEASHLKCSEVILTGESRDVSKRATVTATVTATPPESDAARPGADAQAQTASSKLTFPNVVYSSCTVTEGSGRAVVLLTGMHTHVGQIAALLNSSGTNSDEPVPFHHATEAADATDATDATGKRRHKKNNNNNNGHGDDRRKSFTAAEFTARLGESRSTRLPVQLDDDGNVIDPTSTHVQVHGPNSLHHHSLEEEEHQHLVQHRKSGSCNPCTRLKAWVARQRPKRTPLQDELHHLGMVMTTFAITGAILVMIVGFVRNFRDPTQPDNPAWLQTLMLAVSMAVSAIPEGLPLVVTICLALGVNSMADQHALIKRLPAVETLGSASIICSDKTGTLTTSFMTAVSAWVHDAQYGFDGEGYSPFGVMYADDDGDEDEINAAAATATDNHNHHPVLSTLLVATLCNEANVTQEEDSGIWRPLGSSTEAALVVAAEKSGLRANDTRAAYPQVASVPFNSKYKMMTTVHRLPDAAESDTFTPWFLNGSSSDDNKSVSDDSKHQQESLVVCAKGAPLIILNRCKYIVVAPGSSLQNDNDADASAATAAVADDARIVPLTDKLRRHVSSRIDSMSEQGLRVLAMSCKSIDHLPAEIEADEEDSMDAGDKHQLLSNDMIFCGVVGVMDPPREGVSEAIEKARRGGIRTVMVTGDYLATASSIARQIGLFQHGTDPAATAVDCSEMRPNDQYLEAYEMDQLTAHTLVFARARPADKIEIVKSFQRQGFVCSMTGDGTNDSPALRQADIGVAMGITGSEVAKAASDMILTDDNFASIVAAVELGRTIYANLRKFVLYLIGTNWSQVTAILLCVLVGLPSPLEPLQILYINLCTDSAPAAAMSVEAAETNSMEVPPRKRKERILSGNIALGILGHALILVTMIIGVFLLGLYWNIGNVLLDNMYDVNDNLNTVCSQLLDDGSRKLISDPQCVADGLRTARTMAFLTIAFAETLRPMTARSFSLAFHRKAFRNRPLVAAIVGSLTCTFVIVFVPGVNDVFKLSTPRWFEWLVIFLAVCLTVLVDELVKVKFRSIARDEAQYHEISSRLTDILAEVQNTRLHVHRVEHFQYSRVSQTNPDNAQQLMAQAIEATTGAGAAAAGPAPGTATGTITVQKL
jgi:magnesium-transporting ATPase (P-type)